MFTVDLVALDRSGSLRLDGEVPPEHPLWVESGVELAGPLQVSLGITLGFEEQVLVRGKLEGSVRARCRRCLEEMVVPFHSDMTALLAPASSPLVEGDDEVLPIPVGSTVLSLEEAILHEVMLSVPEYPLCRPDCQGLCPRCGMDRNEVVCDCDTREGDPRWDSLRTLQSNE